MDSNLPSNDFQSAAMKRPAGCMTIDSGQGTDRSCVRQCVDRIEGAHGFHIGNAEDVNRCLRLATLRTESANAKADAVQIRAKDLDFIIKLKFVNVVKDKPKCKPMCNFVWEAPHDE